MKTVHDILSDLWALGGGEPSALDAVTLTGREPMLPSSFRVAGHDCRRRTCRRGNMESPQRRGAGHLRRHDACDRRVPQRTLSAR